MPVIALAALALIALFGFLRLNTDTGATVADVRLRLIQPNVALDEKFRPENRAEILANYIDLSTRGAGPGDAGLSGVTALVWPESAFPFILSRDPEALSRIAAALPPKTVLVTGAARQEIATGAGARRASFFNALQVIDHDGSILDSYDKVHLVPFGEYLPLQSLLDRVGLRQFVHVPGGFQPGRIHRALNVPGLPPVAPLICYEAIFPGAVVPPMPGGARPGLLLNVTNDSWFGLTAGPYQHLAQARLRAIEEGLPLVRDANSGITAFVDPYGRIVSQLALGAQGYLDGPLFKPLPPPLASRYPLLPALLIWLACLALSLAGRRNV
jgi:apolipoprotein N-acyltransferase